MSEKYFYIAVPQEQFQEVKHTFYGAPSSYLKVYNGDYIQQLESQVAELQQLAEKRGKALEDISSHAKLASFESLNGAGNFKEFIESLAVQALQEGDTP